MKSFIYTTMAALALVLGIQSQTEAQTQSSDTYIVVDGYLRYGQNDVYTLENGSKVTVTVDKRSLHVVGAGIVDVAGGYNMLMPTRTDHSNGLCQIDTQAICYENNDLGVCSCEPSQPDPKKLRRVTLRRITPLVATPPPPPPAPPPQN